MLNPFKQESEEEYHANSEFMSASQLYLISKSLHHYKELFMDDPDGEARKPTPSMIRGNLIHKFLLEPSKFKDEYAFEPDPEEARFRSALRSHEQLKGECKRFGLKVSGTKKDLSDRILEKYESSDVPRKIIWDRYVESVCGTKKRVGITQQKMLLGLHKSLNNHSQAKNLLADGVPEVSGYWYDEELDLNCKFRADWITEKGYIIELKSTGDSDYFRFRYKIRDYRYDMRAAWYVRGYNALMKKPPTGFIWLVVEEKPPYSVALYTADDSVMSMGEFGDEDKERYPGYRQCVDRYKKAMQTNTWPGFQNEVQNMSMV